MTPWAVAWQVPLSIGFSRQEYWNGLLFPSPETPHQLTNHLLLLTSLCVEIGDRWLTYIFHLGQQMTRYNTEAPPIRRKANPGGSHSVITVCLGLVTTHTYQHPSSSFPLLHQWVTRDPPSKCGHRWELMESCGFHNGVAVEVWAACWYGLVLRPWLCSIPEDVTEWMVQVQEPWMGSSFWLLAGGPSAMPYRLLQIV